MDFMDLSDFLLFYGILRNGKEFKGLSVSLWKLRGFKENLWDSKEFYGTLIAFKGF